MSSLAHKVWDSVRNTPEEVRSPDLSRHLVHAQEEERKRISRELHDGTGQGLMVLRLYLGLLAAESRDREAQLKLQEALGLLDRTIEDVRRVIGRLSPRSLEELGVSAAIRKEALEVSRNTGMRATLDLPADMAEDGFDTETELALYRCAQEALHNIAKHSRARNFAVGMKLTKGMVRLVIEDDGIGFSVRRSPRGIGLWGMRERIAALGGTVLVRSGAGKGTKIRVTLPVRKPDPVVLSRKAFAASARAVRGGHTVLVS